MSQGEMEMRRVGRRRGRFSVGHCGEGFVVDDCGKIMGSLSSGYVLIPCSRGIEFWFFRLRCDPGTELKGHKISGIPKDSSEIYSIIFHTAYLVYKLSRQVIELGANLMNVSHEYPILGFVAGEIGLITGINELSDNNFHGIRNRLASARDPYYQRFRGQNYPPH